MIGEEQYKRLRREVEVAKAEAERAQGALDQLLRRLEEEFGCKSLGEAKALLKDLQTERDRAASVLEDEMKRYETQWSGAND